MLSPVVFVKAMLRLSACSGFAGIFNRIKKAKVNVSMAAFDVSAPFLSGFVPANPNVSAAVVRWPLLVFGIFRSGDWAQVIKPVVQPIAINVINLIGPKSQVHCDDGAVRWDSLIKQSPASVSVAPNGMQRQLIGVSRIPSRAVCFRSIPAIAEKFWCSFSPIKKAGFGVIRKKDVKCFGGCDLNFHAASYHGGNAAAMEDGNAYI